MNGLNDIVGQDAKEAGRWFSRDNLLINAYWGNKASIVNQQGKDEYVGKGYTIGGWALAQEATVNLTDGGIQLKDVAQTTYFYQRNASSFEPGQDVTLSALFDNGELYAGTTKTKGTSNRMNVPCGPISLYFEETSGNVYNTGFYVTTTNVGLPKFVAIKLEKGVGQTLAHKENGVWVQNRTTRYGDELRRCQEQYINTKGDLNSPYALQAVNSYALFGSVTFPIEMRITPVMRNLTLRRVADGVTIQTTSAVLQGGPRGIFAITGIQPANLVVGEWYQLMCEFDARL